MAGTPLSLLLIRTVAVKTPISFACALLLSSALAGAAHAQYASNPKVVGITLCASGSSASCDAPQTTITQGSQSALQSEADGAAQKANNLSDLPSAAAARSNLGLGSIATQSAGTVAITGGAISGANVSGTNVTASIGTAAFSLAQQVSKILTPEDFGAAGDGTTDDSAALNACSSVAASSYGVCRMGVRQYYAASSITVPTNASLEGGADPGGDVQNWNPSGTRPQIILAAGTTVNLSGRLANTVVTRAGISENPATPQAELANVAAYNGTGVTFQFNAVLDHVILLGHAQAINTNGQANWRIRHVRGDNLAGLNINGMHDWSFAEDVEWMAMLSPASGNQFPTTSVTGAANNGSGLVRLTVASTSGFATGNKLVIYGVAGTTEANGRWTVTVVDGTHLDLQGSAYSHAWTSGGTVVLNTTTRPGPAYAVTNSESPMLVNITEYGYDNAVDLGTGAGWTTIYGLALDDYNIPDPGKLGISIHGTAYGSKLHIGYVSSIWTPLTVNTGNGTGEDPHLIEGGSLYSTAPGGSTQPSLNFLAGSAALDNVSVRGDIINVTASAKLRMTGVSGAGATWLSGANFSNVQIAGSELGDVTGTSLRGPQVNLEVPNGTSWLDTFTVNGSGQVTVGAGAGSPFGVALQIANAWSGDASAGGEFELTNSTPGNPYPNKYFRVDSGGKLNILNSGYTGNVMVVDDSGNLTVSGLSLTGGVAQSSVLAGPASGSGAPTQRVLTTADISGAASTSAVASAIGAALPSQTTGTPYCGSGSAGAAGACSSLITGGNISSGLYSGYYGLGGGLSGNNGVLVLGPLSNTTATPFIDFWGWGRDYSARIINDADGQLDILGDGGANLKINTSGTTTSLPVAAQYFVATPVLVSALPSCVAGLDGAIAVVSDASSPSWNGALTGTGTAHSGGRVLALCDGAAAAWKTH